MGQYEQFKLLVDPFVTSKVEAYFMSCILKTLLTWKAKRHIPSWKPKYNMMLDADFLICFPFCSCIMLILFFGVHPVFRMFWMFCMRFPAGCADRRSLRLEGLRSSYVPWLKDAFRTFMATVPLTQMERQQLFHCFFLQDEFSPTFFTMSERFFLERIGEIGKKCSRNQNSPRSKTIWREALTRRILISEPMIWSCRRTDISSVYKGTRFSCASSFSCELD